MLFDTFGSPLKCSRHPLYGVGMGGCPACWEEEKSEEPYIQQHSRRNYVVCPFCTSGRQKTEEVDGVKRITYKCGTQIDFLQDEIVDVRGEHCEKVEARQAYPIS